MRLSQRQLEAARCYLQEVLARCPAGGRLPSFRAMRQESGLTRAALYAILQEMIAARHLEALPRIGFRRAAQPQGTFIDVVACHNAGYASYKEASVYSIAVDFLWQQLPKEGMTPRLHVVSMSQSPQRYIDIANLADSGGFILVHVCVGEIITAFRATGKPLVLLFPHGRFEGVSQICEENYTISLQMEHLIQLGHTRILYLREEYTNYINLPMMTRLCLYYKTMATRHLPIPEHWRSTYPPGKILSALESSFSKPPTPTALIVYDFDVPVVYDFLRRRGLEVGKEVSVVATDALPFLEGISPTVTTTVNNEKYSVECAIDLLKRQLRGDRTPQTKAVLLRLRRGESTATPL